MKSTLKYKVNLNIYKSEPFPNLFDKNKSPALAENCENRGFDLMIFSEIYFFGYQLRSRTSIDLLESLTSFLKASVSLNPFAPR